jgi:hypothetical protein
MFKDKAAESPDKAYSKYDIYHHEGKHNFQGSCERPTIRKGAVNFDFNLNLESIKMPNTQAPNTSRESPDGQSLFNGQVLRDRSESPGRMIFKDNEGDESPAFNRQQINKGYEVCNTEIAPLMTDMIS